MLRCFWKVGGRRVRVRAAEDRTGGDHEVWVEVERVYVRREGEKTKEKM